VQQILFDFRLFGCAYYSDGDDSACSAVAEEGAQRLEQHGLPSGYSVRDALLQRGFSGHVNTRVHEVEGAVQARVRTGASDVNVIKVSDAFTQDDWR
jgi:hypothetical protein